MRAGARAGLLAIALHAACLPEFRATESGEAPRPSETATCWGVVTDLRSDRGHCGSCTNVCPADAIACLSGSCVCPDARPYACGSACVDIRSDARHCGGCGVSCPSDGRCVGGKCTCVGGLYCFDRCTDVMSDPGNCGGCGVFCPSHSFGCVGGVCRCPSDRPTACGGACVDTRSDAAHCGACGHPCDPGATCLQGACLGSPLAPATGERLGARRPTFRWQGSGEATVDVCADRACATVTVSFAGTASPGAMAPRDLAPGVYFWRVRPAMAARGEGLSGGSFRIDRRATMIQGLLPPGADFNGDGLDDVLVSAGGSVALYLGARAGLGARADASFAVHPATEAPRLRVVGDLRGDGFLSVLASQPGGASLLLGGPSIEGIAPVSRSEFSVATPVLDLNDDRGVDWLRGSPTEAAFLFGAPGSTMLPLTGTPIAASNAVVRAAPAGDVNGDGRRDVLLTAAVPTPRAWVGLGSSAGVDRFLPLPPAPRSEGFGASLACAGDVNGDGFADALVGLGATGAAVYLGGRDALTLQRVIDAPVGAEILVGAAGDVDGDGFGDVIAVPRARGEAWLFRGGATGLPATPIVLPDGRWRNVEALGLPGDRNGDGLDDVVAGAPTEAAVHVFYGAGSGPFSRVETRRGEPGSDAGRHVL